MKDLLTWFTDLSWWIETSVSSVFLFGEYEYPKKEDYE